MEVSTNSSFIVSYSKRLRRYKAITFRCHRSGAQIVKSGARTRRLKLQGSKKLNAICPAEIKFRHLYADSTCDIKFLKTHVGHDLSTKELSHISLPKNEPLRLDVDVLGGVPFNRIMRDSGDDDILMSDFLTLSADKITLLTREDLHAIEHSYNANTREKMREDEDPFANDAEENCDTENAESRSTEINNEDNAGDFEAFIDRYAYCFVYYKRENEPPDEKFPFLEDRDIVVIFMSPSQELLLQKHGSNVITMDRTRNKDSSLFIMHTMLVLDYDGDGIPVAFTITNRDDAAVIDVFLTCIKEKVGPLEPNTLMTDTQETHLDSWKSIMGAPSYHFFCTWHVKKAWELNLSLKIFNKEKRNETRKIIHSLLAEANVDTFYSRFEEFLSNDDPDMHKFVTNFRDTYGREVPSWAYCYRRNAGLGTNLHVEAFHDALKYIHGHRLKLTSLYTGLTTGLEYVKQKLMDTIIKNIRGRMTHKLRTLRRAHDHYVNFISKNEIGIEVVKDDEEWLIPSLQAPEVEDGRQVYTVRRLRETCPAEEDADYGKCNLVCVDCHTCTHLYCCTCTENTVKNNMCSHVHAVASIFGSQKSSTEYVECNSLENKIFETEIPASPTEFVDCDLSENKIFKTEITCDDVKKDAVDFELKVYKEDLLRKMENVKNIVTDAQSSDVLNVIDELLTPLHQQCHMLKPPFPCM